MDTFVVVNGAIFGYLYWGAYHLRFVLPVLCLAGLILIVAGHKLSFRVSYAWYKGVAVAMGFLVVFSVCSCLLGLWCAFAGDRYAIYAVLVFIGSMLFPLIFSVAGLILWFYSRYPIVKGASQPQVTA